MGATGGMVDREYEILEGKVSYCIRHVIEWSFSLPLTIKERILIDNIRRNLPC